MATLDHHTVKAFDEELEEIRASIAELGGLAEAAISASLNALLGSDEEAAAQVVAADGKVDRLAEQVERNCIRIIALRAPMADDLRSILASFKVSVLLERVADCARNIAEQVPKISGFRLNRQIEALRTMLAAVAEMLRSALDAYVSHDAVACRRIWASDEAVDRLHDQLSQDLIERMTQDSSVTGPCTCLLIVSLKLERIGDHAASIAKVVFYSVTGERMQREERSALSRELN